MSRQGMASSNLGQIGERRIASAINRSRHFGLQMGLAARIPLPGDRLIVRPGPCLLGLGPESFEIRVQ